MHIISRRAHGALDYIVGLLLIVSPTLFRFDGPGLQSRVPIVLGILAIVYSLFTNYEFGLLKVLPFRAHLMLDILHGLVLGSSPWVFHFADRVWKPHLLLGIMEIAVVIMTQMPEKIAAPGKPGMPMRA